MRILGDALVSVLVCLSLCLVVYGLHLTYPPLAWIGGGLALFQVSLGIRRSLR